MSKTIETLTEMARKVAEWAGIHTVGAYVAVMFYQAVLGVALLASLAAYCGGMLGDEETAPPDAGPSRAEVTEALHRQDADPQRVFDAAARYTTISLIV